MAILVFIAWMGSIVLAAVVAEKMARSALAWGMGGLLFGPLILVALAFACLIDMHPLQAEAVAQRRGQKAADATRRTEQKAVRREAPKQPSVWKTATTREIVASAVVAAIIAAAITVVVWMLV